LIYKKPNLKLLSINTEKPDDWQKEGDMKVSLTAILGCVQSAYDDARVSPALSLEIKRKLLRLASEGQGEQVIYHAILDVLTHQNEPGASDTDSIGRGD